MIKMKIKMNYFDFINILLPKVVRFWILDIEMIDADSFNNKLV